jgi:hypothetical protein
MAIKTKIKMVQGNLIIILHEKYCTKLDLRLGDTINVALNSKKSLRLEQMTEHRTTREEEIERINSKYDKLIV